MSARHVQSVPVETLQWLEQRVDGLRDSTSNLESAGVVTLISQRKERTHMTGKLLELLVTLQTHS